MTTSLLLVQRRLTHYRVPFFEALAEALAKRAIELRLAVGQPTPAERSKNDEGHLEWARVVPTRYLLDGALCWMDLAPQIKGVEIAIVTHENKMLNNLPLLFGRRGPRTALWGHGRNFQATRWKAGPQWVREAISRRADWWFAYTQVSTDAVRQHGFPADRITTVNNSVDTQQLAGQIQQALTGASVAELRRKHGLPEQCTLGIFVGSLYEEKRLDLLVEAAQVIHDEVPNFRLAVVGDGPMRGWLQQAASSRPWLHCAGVQKGQAKAELLAASDLMLNPGLVGLGILDSFAAGLPMITTDCGLHSPEIAYLDDGINGHMVEPTSHAVAACALGLLTQPERLKAMAAACRASASHYTLDAMVQRFAAGVAQWRSAGARS